MSAQRLTVTARQFYSIATAGNAAERGEKTPTVIANIRVDVRDGVLTAVATDRHKLARVTFPVEANDLPATLLPAEPLRKLARTISTARTSLDPFNDELTIHVDDEAIAVTGTFGDDLLAEAVPTDNYPPVEKLFHDKDAALELHRHLACIDVTRLATAATVRLPDDVHRTSAGRKWQVDDERARRLDMVVTASPIRAGHLWAWRDGSDGGRFDWLMQPYLGR